MHFKKAVILFVGQFILFNGVQSQSAYPVLYEGENGQLLELINDSICKYSYEEKYGGEFVKGVMTIGTVYAEGKYKIDDNFLNVDCSNIPGKSSQWKFKVEDDGMYAPYISFHITDSIHKPVSLVRVICKEHYKNVSGDSTMELHMTETDTNGYARIDLKTRHDSIDVELFSKDIQINKKFPANKDLACKYQFIFTFPDLYKGDEDQLIFEYRAGSNNLIFLRLIGKDFGLNAYRPITPK